MICTSECGFRSHLTSAGNESGIIMSHIDNWSRELKRNVVLLRAILKRLLEKCEPLLGFPK